MRRSPSIPASCVGMKLMKVVTRMNMRSCMHTPDDHHDELIKGSGGCNHQIKTSKSKSKSKSKSSSSSSIIKVVNWEGGIMKTYWRPIKVGEVIIESPKHQSYMVCSSDSLYIGQKIPPLSDHHLLQPGHTYFLLPSHLFTSALSFATVASILSTSSSAPHASSQNNNNSILIKKKKKKKKKSLEPFLIQKSPSGCSTIRVSDDFIISHIVDEDEDEDDDDDDKYRSCLCTTPQLQKEYAQLVQPRRPQWKPNLPTITESKSNYSKRRRRRLKNKLNNNISSNASTSSISNNTKGYRKMKLFKSTKSSSSSHYSCPKSS